MMRRSNKGGFLRAIARWNSYTVAVGLALWLFSAFSPRTADFKFIGQAEANMPGTFNPMFSGSSVVVPIGTPVSLGTAANQSANVSSFAITASTSVAIGYLVCAAPSYDDLASGVTITSVTDNLSTPTTYTGTTVNRNVTVLSMSGIYCGLAVVAGTPTITATLSGTTSGANGWGIAAWKVSGISTATADTGGAASYNGAASTAPTSTTSALAQVNEISFGISHGGYTGCGTWADGSGFSSLIASFAAGNASGVRLLVSYRINLSGTGAVTYASTVTVACNNHTNKLVRTYKGF